MIDPGTPAAQDVLLAAYAELQAHVVPRLEHPDAVRSATMIADLLRHLAAGRAGQVATNLAALSADRSAVLTAGKDAMARVAAMEVPVDAALATTLVREALDVGAVIARVGRAAGGYSKDTLFLSGVGADGAPIELVVRRDLPFGPAGTTVVDEYALLTALHRFDLPIAAPLGLDTTGILGEPAMLSARVAGSSGVEPWAGNPTLCETVCRELAQAMARLHAVPVAEVIPALAGADPADIVRDYVAGWRARWIATRTGPSDVLEQCYDWLDANVPAQVARMAIVHGDIGFHNVMVDDGRVAAILDWEFAHAGDPVEDLSYVRQFIEPVLDWDRFVGFYRAAGGVEYASENAGFWEVWRHVRNATCCMTAWHGFVTGKYPAVKMAYQGLELYPRFTEQAGLILAAKSAAGDATAKK